jgi:predicted pyridoxine 5'-phosphate oxidase superfamily flavin-nucleotide-binding protein
MVALPEIVKEAWEAREGYPVFTTVDTSGQPNAIYVGAIGIYDDHTIVIAENYLNKTKANILSGSRASLVFLTKSRKSYQIKGSIEYTKSGPLFEFMKTVNIPGYPGHAAVALKVESVYSGAEKLTEE